MRDRAVALLQLETDLRNGIEQNAFVVHYQPIVSLEIDEGGSEMVRAIVALAHNLSMDVVAEGVETEAQFIHLRALGCEYTQGFHFSKPVDAQAADTLIASQPWRDVLEATRSYSAYSASLSGERLSLG